MDKEKLKLIVRNLKSLVDVLESKVYSDVTAYKYENKQQLTTVAVKSLMTTTDAINEGQKNSKEKSSNWQRNIPTGIQQDVMYAKLIKKQLKQSEQRKTDQCNS